MAALEKNNGKITSIIKIVRDKKEDSLELENEHSGSLDDVEVKVVSTKTRAINEHDEGYHYELYHGNIQDSLIKNHFPIFQDFEVTFSGVKNFKELSEFSIFYDCFVENNGATMVNNGDLYCLKGIASKLCFVAEEKKQNNKTEDIATNERGSNSSTSVIKLKDGQCDLLFESMGESLLLVKDSNVDFLITELNHMISKSQDQGNQLNQENVNNFSTKNGSENK